MLPTIAQPFGPPPDSRLFFRCGGDWDTCGATIAVPRSTLTEGGLGAALSGWTQSFGGGLVAQESGGLSAAAFRCRDCLRGALLIPVGQPERVVLHCGGVNGERCRASVAIPVGVLRDLQAMEGALALSRWVIGSGHLSMPGPRGNINVPSFNPICPTHGPMVSGPEAWKQLLQNRGVAL